MNLLLLTSHSILEYDELRLFHGLGIDVFSIGTYTDPANPVDNIRPPAPEVPSHPELEALCNLQREKHSGEETPPGVIDWAKGDLHPDLIDWADVIVCSMFPESWIAAQWGKFTGKRVIWRTCGQSNAGLEEKMGALHKRGLEIVRYSPAEKRAMTRLGVFAGEDALIRFAKDPTEWYGWTGEDPVVGNVTQNMADRGEFCGLHFWLSATDGLPAKPAGLGSERLPGGLGALTYDEMRAYLRNIRTYLYTGTQPASYTLGLIEAMMTGVPVVSIGPENMWVPDLFEGEEIAGCSGDASTVKGYLRQLLDRDHLSDLPDQEIGSHLSTLQRAKAIELFGIGTISAQWAAFLGVRVPEAVAA